ncbi:glucan 1,3-beta-glucosidase-like [Papaver somniferum]|uniref:glucan 1,3-beta-glucosidase-like n=1 Tax=Papaver somniferum TaxID=3469 RepID=UPI000E7006E1|nr:glucan 1,3-beta-glucosidase-like [Papaver somniferum]
MAFTFVYFLSWAHSALALDELNGAIVKGVNLGGWLVLEGFITPSLFEGILNPTMLDGTKVRFKSLRSNKYVSAQKGGDSGIITVHKDKARTRETFRVSSGNELRADHEGMPTGDDDAATFQMIIDVKMNIKGDYQLDNGYGLEKAAEVLSNHRSNFVTQADFQFLSRNGINTVRIPVGWQYGIKCIIDLHAAPGSQNGMEHSSSRDGTIDWTTSDNIQQTLRVIDFLASKYGNHDALSGIV